MAGINGSLIGFGSCGISRNGDHDTISHVAKTIAGEHRAWVGFAARKRRGKRKIRSNAPKDLLTLLERTIILPLATTKRLDA